jgi:hypothetical protein
LQTVINALDETAIRRLLTDPDVLRYLPDGANFDVVQYYVNVGTSYTRQLELPLTDVRPGTLHSGVQVGEDGIAVNPRTGNRVTTPGCAPCVFSFPEGTRQAELYPNGVYINSQGFPDFTPYSEINVTIEVTGVPRTDFARANAAAGLTETPAGYTWHHHQDGRTMQLVPSTLNNVSMGGVAHTGGATFVDVLGSPPAP